MKRNHKFHLYQFAKRHIKKVVFNGEEIKQYNFTNIDSAVFQTFKAFDSINIHYDISFVKYGRNNILTIIAVFKFIENNEVYFANNVASINLGTDFDPDTYIECKKVNKFPPKIEDILLEELTHEDKTKT